jgi:hypothetical protein
MLFEIKKTPVTVGGFGVPYALLTKAHDPPVTGVSYEKK